MPKFILAQLGFEALQSQHFSFPGILTNTSKALIIIKIIMLNCINKNMCHAKIKIKEFIYLNILILFELFVRRLFKLFESLVI